jgi:3-oxo-5-alpha-steroid 4-dehydrogenase 1
MEAPAPVVFAFVYLQGTDRGELGSYPTDWLTDPRFLLGVTLFAAGLAVHVTCDRTLRGLRAPGDAGYRIPRGGWYRWVSSPNYLGEIVEWTGWALATLPVRGAPEDTSAPPREQGR